MGVEWEVGEVRGGGREEGEERGGGGSNNSISDVPRISCAMSAIFRALDEISKQNMFSSCIWCVMTAMSRATSVSSRI